MCCNAHKFFVARGALGSTFVLLYDDALLVFQLTLAKLLLRVLQGWNEIGGLVNAVGTY